MIKKIRLIIVIAIILFASILISFPLLWNTSLKGSIRGSSFYLDKTYVDFYGGKEAMSFFEKYIMSKEYLAIDFYYSDEGRMMFPLMKSYTAFIVDIYFKEEVFNDFIQNILNKGYESVALKNSFDFVKIEDKDKLYEDNFAAIGWDTSHNSVRYVFVCDVKNGKVYNVQSLYLRFYDLNWNDNENDYIFDYSEIVVSQ